MGALASGEGNVHGDRTDRQAVLVEERSDTPTAQGLLSDFVATIRAQYPDFDPDTGPSATPQDFSAPHGAFFVAYVGEQAVGCCGFKFIDEQVVEIKRLWVTPQGRGRGLGRRLLQACEAKAVALGASLARLDTGERQREALGLFAANGYRPIDDYNGNPSASYWFERPLP
jgi:GNAT superfamily N-acetyltransferase